jgi:hypothetical protein
LIQVSLHTSALQKLQYPELQHFQVNSHASYLIMRALATRYFPPVLVNTHPFHQINIALAAQHIVYIYPCSPVYSHPCCQIMRAPSNATQCVCFPLFSG